MTKLKSNIKRWATCAITMVGVIMYRREITDGGDDYGADDDNGVDDDNDAVSGIP